MLYPKNFEDKIEFGKIRDLIKKNCLSLPGTAHTDRIQFSTDPEEITVSLNQTLEFRRIIQSGETFPLSDYIDYGIFFIKASKFDSYLTEEEFHNLNLSLTTLGKMLDFLTKKSGEYPELALLTVGVYLNPNLSASIHRTLDEHGKIRDHASPELNEIRSSLRKQHLRVRKTMEKMLGEYITDGFSNDDATVTLRNGRLVLPVRAEYKRKVKGFIHDESASGQTAFIEPAGALEINNDIMDLEYQEKREVIRILSALTDLIRPEISNLQKCLEFLGLVDFIQAKAKLAIMLEANRPAVVKKTHMEWRQARHPLLFLSHKSLGKPVVPLDLTLTGENRILIISGPNAGGKSVCLKTIGLIQYMFQCGILVPVDESSVMGIFNSILVDIGDEQSIENDLSTYSSHLIAMKSFLAYAAQRTLFLIDEFGTGTEPQLGGAIAESILDQLLESRAYGIITTHYSNLKKYAEEHPGIMNGAMRFDINRMEPLFILDTGRPGSSFAIEIARNIGLPESILQSAQKRVGFDQVNYEKLLAELENERIDLSEKVSRLDVKEAELKKLTAEYDQLKEWLDSKKKEIIQDARAQAYEVLNEANKTVEKTIREIRESQADKRKTRVLRDQLKSEKNKNRVSETGKKHIPVKEAIPAVLKPGQMARIIGQETVGQILTIRENEAELAVGQLKMRVLLDRLEPVSRHTVSQAKIPRDLPPVKGLDFNEKLKNFSTTLDIRGLRGEEAIMQLDRYLDQALFLNMNEIKILHGKGNGILRKLVREQLSRYHFIDTVKDEHVDHGGAGITVVTLK